MWFLGGGGGGWRVGGCGMWVCGGADEETLGEIILRGLVAVEEGGRRQGGRKMVVVGREGDRAMEEGRRGGAELRLDISWQLLLLLLLFSPEARYHSLGN